MPFSIPVPPAPVVYALTAFCVVVVLVTRRLLSGGGQRVRTGHGVSRALLNLHSGAGLVATVLWVPFLIAGADGAVWHSLVGVFGLAAWWLTGVTGLFLLGRWLPTKGRHSDAGAGWVRGFILAAIGHIGLAFAALGFTVAYVLGSV